MGRTIYAGDLHLGNGGRGDMSLATRNPKMMREIVGYWNSIDARLILGGDIFEALAFSLHDVIATHGYLLDDISQMVVPGGLIIGNHGRHAISKYVGQSVLHNLLKKAAHSHSTARTLVLHGHEGDSSCMSAKPGLDTITAIITRHIAEKRGCDTDRALWPFQAALAVHRWLHGKKSSQEQHVESMRVALAESGRERVPCGHTHAAGTIGRWYWNWGCLCGDGPYTFIEEEESTGDMRIVEWTKGGPKEFSREL